MKEEEKTRFLIIFLPCGSYIIRFLCHTRYINYYYDYANHIVQFFTLAYKRCILYYIYALVTHRLVCVFSKNFNNGKLFLKNFSFFFHTKNKKRFLYRVPYVY